MKISTKGRYALRMMIDLGQHQGSNYITLKDICERQNISLKYLEQIVAVLAKAKLVKSCRGPQGGYQLVREPSDYTIGEILRLIEGDLNPVPCINCDDYCDRQNRCATFGFWQGLKDSIAEFMDSHTLQELVDEANLKEKNND